MHGITTEPPHIYAMVIKYMSVKTIVMPNFLILLVLKVILEIANQPRVLAKIINEHFWPIPKVKFWSCKEGSANNLAISDW